MGKHFMIAVDWYGPYTDMDAARSIARYDYDQGLYLCIGTVENQTVARPQYIGIGSTLANRLNERHHALRQIAGRNLWLGQVVTAEPGGRKQKATQATLDFAEWLHARFMQLPLNQKKKKTFPDRGVTVLNRWWRPDYETAHRRRPHPEWPDLIDVPHYGLPARAVWFGGKQRLFDPNDYAAST